MNPQGFSFPPPPPPPPTQHQQSPPHPHNTAYTSYGQNYHGQRGGHAGGGRHFRGRGRGHGGRGGGRGGHSGAYPSTTSVGYGPMTYSGYPAQPMPTPQQNISAPHYSQSPSQNYPGPLNQSSYAPTRTYPQPPAAHGQPYQHHPSYDTSYASPTTQQAPAYSHASSSYQYAAPSVQPTMGAPPMHWSHPGPYAGPQRLNQRGPRQFNAYTHPDSSAERPMKHKRDHSSAFGKPQSVTPRIPAPPPVPSFGNPLPSKPPPPADSPRKPKKKKRKHNQLGLTPKTVEHESSEEEDDADEESRLAAGGAGPSGPLQVTYRGRTSKLQTAAEIAAWIEERKKRFPTQAKIEEKKKAMEEAKKAREETWRQQEAKNQAMKREKEQEKHSRKERARDSVDPADAAAKAKLKAEKLRRKLMKEERRLAQAEADAERARMKLEESANGTLDANTRPASTAEEAQSSAMPGDQAVDNSLSDTSDSSDWTSSSGSELSSSDSEDSDDDSAPEQSTTRREGPERVPPPAREAKKRVCHQFARTGRCSRGNRCKFPHEARERGVRKKTVEQKGRKGLLQALLDRQKEEENRKLMETIMWLGENGLLDEPATREDVSGDPTAAENRSTAQAHDENQQLSEGTAQAPETGGSAAAV